jgi:tellurite resistance protein
MKTTPSTTYAKTNPVKEHEVEGVKTVIKFLTALRTKAVKNEIRATKAIRLMLEAHPELSRTETYKGAERAGINQLTARNVYDTYHVS